MFQMFHGLHLQFVTLYVLQIGRDVGYPNSFLEAILFSCLPYFDLLTCGTPASSTFSRARAWNRSIDTRSTTRDLVSFPASNVGSSVSITFEGEEKHTTWG